MGAIADRPPTKEKPEATAWVCVLLLGDRIIAIHGIFNTSKRALDFGQSVTTEPRMSIQSFPLNADVGAFGPGAIDSYVGPPMHDVEFPDKK